MTLVVIAGIFYLLSPEGKTKVSFSPLQFDELFKKYAAQYGLDWKMLKAIAMNEAGLGVVSGGIEKSVLHGILNPKDIENSKSSDGKSWGIMQVTLPTARDFDASATAEKLNNPEYSVRIAAQYIAWVTMRFKQTDPRYWEWVVKSYNQGVGNTQKEMNGISHSMTSHVQKYWERYLRNYALIK